MVRVVQEQVEEQKALDKPSIALFRLLGIVVADKPQQLADLLRNYSVQLPVEPSASALTEAAIFAIGQQANEFNYDLAQLLASQRIPESDDSFVPSSLIRYAAPPKLPLKPTAEQIIAASMSRTFQKGLSAKNVQHLTKQAKQESMKSTIKYKTHQELEEKEESEAASKKEKSNTTLIVGTIAAVTLVGGIIIWRINKSKPALTAEIN